MPLTMGLKGEAQRPPSLTYMLMAKSAFSRRVLVLMPSHVAITSSSSVFSNPGPLKFLEKFLEKRRRLKSPLT